MDTQNSIKRQGLEIALLNDQFYQHMGERDLHKREELGRRLLAEAEKIESDGLHDIWAPLLYSLMARCYLDIGDSEKAVAYSRDALIIGESGKIDLLEDYRNLDEYNLHPLKTQRDMAVVLVSDFEKVVLLQERILKVTPYPQDEERLMYHFRNILEAEKTKGVRPEKTYDQLCEDVGWITKKREEIVGS